MKHKLLGEKEERVASVIVNAAFQVHKELGPGLLEKVYEVCLSHMINKSGLSVRRQVPGRLPIGSGTASHFFGPFWGCFRSPPARSRCVLKRCP